MRTHGRTRTQEGLEDAERSKVECQVEAEHCLKAQVKMWQAKLADIKKEMVSRTKEKDREAKELQKAEVKLGRAAWGITNTLWYVGSVCHIIYLWRLHGVPSISSCALLVFHL